MASVSWKDIARYVEGAYALAGRVERADAIDLAFQDGASDDTVDALDAIGSRVFPTPQAARQFLVARGYLAE